MTINDLIKRCKCGIFMTVSEYRDYYQTIDEAIAEADVEDMDKDAEERIRATGQIVRLQFYPDTPIGFYVIFDSTIEDVLRRAEKVLAEMGR